MHQCHLLSFRGADFDGFQLLRQVCVSWQACFCCKQSCKTNFVLLNSRYLLSTPYSQSVSLPGNSGNCPACDNTKLSTVDSRAVPVANLRSGTHCLIMSSLSIIHRFVPVSSRNSPFLASLEFMLHMSDRSTFAVLFRLRNDLSCVGWGVRLCSLAHSLALQYRSFDYFGQNWLTRTWSDSMVRHLARDVFEYRMFKTKAKATTFCPRAVLEVEDSPWGPHPCIKRLHVQGGPKK